MKTITGLKLLLHSHAMNQSQLAEQLGISSTTVSNWATGKVKMNQQWQEKIMVAVKRNNTLATPTIEDSPVIEIEKTEDSSGFISKAKTLEGKIRECKRLCLESYGFEIVVVKMKN